ILDIVLINKAVWAASGVVLNAIEQSSGSHYYNDFDVVANFFTPVSKAEFSNSATGGYAYLQKDGYDFSAFGVFTTGSSYSAPDGAMYDVDDTLTMTVATTGSSISPTGQLVIRVIYANPGTVTEAVFS